MKTLAEIKKDIAFWTQQRQTWENFMNREQVDIDKLEKKKKSLQKQLLKNEQSIKVMQDRFNSSAECFQNAQQNLVNLNDLLKSPVKI